MNEQSQIAYMQEHPSITTVTSTSTNIVTSTTTDTIQIPYYTMPTSDTASSISRSPLDIHLGQKVPIPTGIADYGVANISGVLSAYKIAASQVVAQATINSIRAYNSSVNSYLVTLQLNLDLNVNTTSGTQEFWVQNIAFFQTNTNYMNFNNEIWNLSTTHSELTNSTISGTAGDEISGGTLSSASGYGTQYTLPFALDFFSNESVISDGIQIMMGYQISRGAPQAQGVYDTIHIKIAGVTEAAFTVDGFSPLSTGNLNEAELCIWGASWWCFYYLHIDGHVSRFAVYPN